MKRSADEPPQRHPGPANRNIRWKRTALLALLLVCLCFGAVIELGHPAAGKARKHGILAALLEDPLSLISARSPGGRGAGALLSTKAGGPHERVLAEERTRDPGLGGAEDPSSAVSPETLAALGNPLPGGGAPAGGDGLPGGGAPAGDSGLPGGGGGDPGGVGNPGGDPGGPFAPADFAGPQFLQNGAPGTPGTPNNDPPPGTGGSNPPPLTGPLPAVPEPATWAVMILGFFATGAALRRARKLEAGLTRVPSRQS